MAVGRQVGDRAAVGHVAVDDAWLSGGHRVDDRAAVFVAAVDFHLFAVFAECFHPLEFVDDRVAAAQVFIDRHVESSDHLRAARDETGIVFGVVLGAFGDEIAEPLHQLESHGVGGEISGSFIASKSRGYRSTPSFSSFR